MRLLRLHTVLAATDLAHSSDAALDAAARLAGASGARLHVAHVVPGDDEIIAVSGRRSEYVEEVRQALRRAGASPDAATIHVVSGDPRLVVGTLANQLNADVIVMGRRRPGTATHEGRPVGGTAYAVITQTSAPCLIVTLPLRLPIRHALAPIDYSETARGALLVAATWAAALRPRDGAAVEPTLTVLHVDTGASEPAETRTAIDHELEVLQRNAGHWAGVSVAAVTLRHADPVSAITEQAVQLAPDLIVMGTRGLGSATDPGLGSVATAVTRRLEQPVLLVPPAVWRDYARDLAD